MITGTIVTGELRAVRLMAETDLGRGGFAFHVIRRVPGVREPHALYVFERLLATVTALEKRQRKV